MINDARISELTLVLDVPFERERDRDRDRERKGGREGESMCVRESAIGKAHQRDELVYCKK